MTRWLLTMDLWAYYYFEALTYIWPMVNTDLYPVDTFKIICHQATKMHKGSFIIENFFVKLCVFVYS